MRVLDLFSGIGGFSLGLERAGMTTVAFCEIDPFCRRVLAKHWPGVRCYDDIRTLTAARLAADGIGEAVADASGERFQEGGELRPAQSAQRAGGNRIEVICGGFPCQDISNAGKRAGIEGERSGLWSEYARLIGELRPRFVIVENVAALVGRGLDRVLGDLASLGFDAEWHCIPASAVGAPHRRDRVWIVAHSERHGAGRRQQLAQGGEGAGHVANAPRIGRRKNVEHVDGQAGGGAITRFLARCPETGNGHWLAEPDVGRVAHGVPSRVDRLRSLGNAVVPQIPEIIGRAIMEAA